MSIAMPTLRRASAPTPDPALLVALPCGGLAADLALPHDCPHLAGGPDGVLDPLTLAQMIRRGVEVVAQGLGLAPQDHFILKSVRIGVDRAALARVATAVAEGCRVRIHVPLDRLRRRRDGGPLALSGPFRCTMAGETLAEDEGTVAFLTPAGFRALRGDDAAPAFGIPHGRVAPLSPGLVGRDDRAMVLIGALTAGPDGDRATIVPQARPPAYDRPLDHYPGFCMAEAARQLALASACRRFGLAPQALRLERAEMAFLSFAELDSPPVLHVDAVRSDGPSTLRMQLLALQAGTLRARFTLSLRIATRQEGEP